MKGTKRYVVLISAAAFAVGAHPIAALASTAPGLGTAAQYAVLAGTPAVTNTLSSVISGNLGIFPAASVIGFPPGVVVNGTIQAGTAAAGTAQSNPTTAYGVAASSPCNFNGTGQNLGGRTLTPGTYCQTTAPPLVGTVTLRGNGVFIFRIGSTLVTAPGATVVLTGGAQPCNVFWQVSSSATLDTTTTFVGTIMALTDIHLNNAASIEGRALARNGTVTLINNRITAPTSCAATTVSGPPVPAPGGPPGTGGAPPRGEEAPWLLVLVGGVLSVGAVSLGLSLRANRRSR
jgi:hypothetical protein